MAEGLLRHWASENDLAIDVSSAGLAAACAAPAAPHAILAMMECGIDISGHRSHQLDAEDILQADVIVPMCKNYALEIAESFPDSEPKIAQFSEDVPDPFKEPIERYRQTRDTIRALIEELMNLSASKE
jgi:protein-tyrosine phosphatase